MVRLNPGRTLVEICVTSVSGKTTSIYTITAVKNRLPLALRLKEKSSKFECAVCCNVVHLPARIKGGSDLYCRACLQELTRTNKTDPFTVGRKLDEEGWLESDMKCDEELAKQVAVSDTVSGRVEVAMEQMGEKLMAERLKAAKAEEVIMREREKASSDTPCTIFFFFLSQLSPVQTAARRFLPKIWHCTGSCCVRPNTQCLSPSHQSSLSPGSTDWWTNRVAMMSKCCYKKAKNGSPNTYRAFLKQVYTCSYSYMYIHVYT